MRIEQLIRMHKDVIHENAAKHVDEYAHQVAIFVKENGERGIINGLSAKQHKILDKLPLKIEEKSIKKYPYSLLKYVCSDCFCAPDASVTPSTQEAV